MKRLPLLLSILLCASPAPILATPITYMGSLSVAGGGGDGILIASGTVWNNPTMKLSWVVDNATTPGRWHYSYTLQTPGPGAAISHIIFEVSDADPGPAFTLANLFAPTTNPAGWIALVDGIEVQEYDAGEGNPDMPGSVYGIKFNAAMEATVLTISFDSDRIPVWGDFYAKDGKVGGIFNTVYNAGFADPDPLAAPHDGAEMNHLLVPDSITVQVPAPAAIVLAAIGVGLVGRVRRFRAA